MSPRAALRFDAASVVVGIVTVLAALALKHVYATAGAGELGWVLAPSCGLANALGGLALVREAGAGFITSEPPMIVGAACAGVNFLVIAWLALHFTLQGRRDGVLGKLGVALGSLLVAYAATVLTNGVRIALAARIAGVSVPSLGLTSGGAHRLLGVVLYVGTLFVLCRVADALAHAATAEDRARAANVALGFYVAVAVLLPGVHRGAEAATPRFLEHALVTVGVATLVRLLLGGLDRIGSRNEPST